MPPTFQGEAVSTDLPTNIPLGDPWGISGNLHFDGEFGKAANATYSGEWTRLYRPTRN